MTDERFVRASLRFEPPRDAFERLTGRRRRAVLNRRIGAAATAFLIVALIAGAVIRNLPPPVSPVDDASPSRVPSVVTPSPPPLTEPPFRFWDDGGGRFVGTVTMQDSGCSLNLVDGPVPIAERNPGKIHIGFESETGSPVVFDVGRIADGYTFEELVEDVAAMAGEVQRDGTPMVAREPSHLRYFVGRPPSFEFVQPAWVDAGGGPWLSGGHELPAVLYTSTWAGGWVGPPSGTYAVICYATVPGAADLVPVGVAGPIVASEVLESP